MNRHFVIGSRGSDLALWQANFVKSSLKNFFPESSFEIKIITTTGDELVDVALSKIGDKGLFTRQIEQQLLHGGIDIAVHSLKDLQTTQPEGLSISAICEREIPNDVLIAKKGETVYSLSNGARVATGSLRRKSQLLHYRPDLNVEEIRGNVPTRLRKFDESELDAIILAYAGIRRLGFESRISELIPFNIMLPAVGQGAVAVETRKDDLEVIALTAKLDHYPTRVGVTAERAFLRQLEGGCQVPIGAMAVIENEHLALEGMVGNIDGTVVFRDRIEGHFTEAEELGTRLADSLIGLGARELLENTRAAAEGAVETVL